MTQRARITLHTAAVADEVRDAGARGALLGAEHILQVARTQVPHEEGTLERSGATSVDPDTLTAAVSFDQPYAVRQHEELGYQHDDGRKAKYLEDPMRDEGPVAVDIMAAQIRRALR